MEEENDPHLVNDIFRAVHSVKSAAGFFKKGALEAVTHTAEAILWQIREGRAQLSTAVITTLLEAVNALKGFLNRPDFGDGCDTRALCGRLQSQLEQLGGSAVVPLSPPTVAACGFSALHSATARSLLQSGTHFYGMHLRYQHNEAGSAEQRLSVLLENLATIIHLSAPLEELSPGVPHIEGYLQSVAEEALFVPYMAQQGLEVCELAPVPAPTVDKSNSPATASPGTPRGRIEAPGALSDEPGGAVELPRPARQTIRIGVDVLDELLELIGEVVLGRNQFIHKYQNDKGFKSLSQSIIKLHQHVIQTRMQPIGTLFEKYRRTVRDLSETLGKKIELILEGGELELDRTIIEGLADPLTHLVRNSVDHGIETPEERSLLSKSVVGTVSLRAIHESGQILIEIEDDGRGLDSQRIVHKALERGLVDAAEASGLEEKQIFNFIFAPGFSTKDVVTEISGRGVGMDVVRTNLQKLGCSIELTSRKNKGALTAISIPLTQAVVNSSVISGLIISIGDYSLAIPQLAVNEIIKLAPGEQFDKIETVQGREVFKLRYKIIPLVHLEDIFGITRTCYNPCQNRSMPDRRTQLINKDDAPVIERRNRSVIFIVLNFKHDYFGALVDKIERTEEIVVKRLPLLVKNRKVFAGATILGNGKVSLILDINGMVEKAGLNFDKKREAHFEIMWLKTQREEIQKLVIFNNAEQEYFAIPVNLLSEVDRFGTTEIRTVGTREFIKRHGESIPLLRLESVLAVSALAAHKSSHIILIPSRLKYPTDIVGNSIVTTIDLTEEINTKEADEQGVMGTFFHESKLINLLDIYTLIQRSDPNRYKAEIDDNIENCRVLFAEDQLFFRQLVSQSFKSYGVKKITVVKNGQEALQCLYDTPGNFDVIVSDIEMPVMNGYQLVASIKSDKRFLGIPVMALTTLDSEHNMRKGYEAGFDAYEIKLDKDSVIKRLEQLYLSRNSLRAPAL